MRPRAYHRERSRHTLRASAEPMLWLSGGALAICLAMIVGLLVLVLVQGIGTFWPQPLVAVELADGRKALGEVTRQELFAPDVDQLAALPSEVADRARAQMAAQQGKIERRLFRIGNFELTGDHFAWIDTPSIVRETRPQDAIVVERLSWGRFYGYLTAFQIGDERVATGAEESWQAFERHHDSVRARFDERRGLERTNIGHASRRLEEARLAVRAAELEYGANTAEHTSAQLEYERIQAEAERQIEAIRQRITAINAENAKYGLVLTTADGHEKVLEVEGIVRAYRANELGFVDSLGVYLSRWWEFLTDEPREANQEGGVFPAIFGTVLMTLLMSLAVVPFGVLAALYIREYAKAGPLISAVRIAVNNLAGVPSIVFGVFGLGFFCYTIGTSIDELLFAERLPNPTFGTGGLLWSSLTLALLTLPVVIVATEESLAAVPSSMREGSYACGASKWQTIRRIVLPRAMPGIMTGMILAMARGAGEVAPLMLVGVVKLAPELALDGEWPFLHPERSFMHLGFHIYDQGFQSQNSEASKPMVYTTTLLLIGIVAALNVAAVAIRSRLRRKFVGAQF